MRKKLELREHRRSPFGYITLAARFESSVKDVTKERSRNGRR